MSARKTESEVIDSGLFLRTNATVQMVRYFTVDGLYTHELVTGRYVKRTKAEWVIRVAGKTRQLDRKSWQPCSS